MPTSTTHRRMRRLMLLAVALVAAVIALVIYGVGLFKALELQSVDARFSVRGNRPVHGVAVVGLDESTFQIFDKTNPLPRRIHARVIDNLRRAGAKVIVYDIQYSTLRLESLPLVATELALHRRIRRAELGGSTAYIDYAGPPGRVPLYSLAEVYYNRVPARLLRGRIVVVGATTPTLQDLHPTSTTSGDLMSGPEIEASAVSTALRGFPLQPAPRGITYVLILLFAAVPPLVASRFRWQLGPLAALLLAGVYAVIAQLLFNGGVIVSFAYPLIALLIAAIGTILVGAVAAALDRERVRTLFASFVPVQVVDDVIARAEGLRLGGQEIEGTMLFSDLRGFTSYSETKPADRVLEVLNRYLTEMTDAILDHGGTLTAFMGDGIMALFGGPIEQHDHADRAVEAAHDMLHRLEGFNRWLSGAGLGEGFRMGIGINSGLVMAGNVGSERRLDYTAIGDAVNTASRLEGMTKGTPHQLFISDSTRQALRRAQFDLIEVGEQQVRGRSAAVRIWSTREGTDPSHLELLSATGALA